MGASVLALVGINAILAIIDINPTIYRTISLLEAFWAIVNFLTAPVVYDNIREARGDLKQACIDLETNHERRQGFLKDRVRAARGYLRNDSARGRWCIFRILIGSLALLAPSPQVPEISVIGQIITLVFIGWAIDEARLAILDRLDRKHFLGKPWYDGVPRPMLSVYLFFRKQVAE